LLEEPIEDCSTSNPEAVKIILPSNNEPSKKSRKRVQWRDDQLEQVKYFKQNDEPSAPGLSEKEVLEIQKCLADVPSHMIPAELSRIEMKLDRQKREE
jgi:hypothetical protein